MDHVYERERFYTSLRGSARIEARGDSADLELAMMTPHFLRAEIMGPLGIRLGLVQINEEWAQFYDVRKKELSRLPFKEFRKNNLRRERFLRALPVPFMGPAFVDYILSRSGIPAAPLGEKVLRSCDYDGDLNVYKMLFAEESDLEARYLWHLVEIDPTNFHPVRHRSLLRPRTAVILATDPDWQVSDWDLRYSQFWGRGFSTLPRRVEIFQREDLIWAFEWVEAERIEDRGAEIFQWRPPASIKVQDY